MSKIVPFDSFIAIYKLLIRAGYFKPLNEPKSRIKNVLHKAYRVIIIIVLFIYASQYMIFAFLVRKDMEKLTDCLMIGIPQLNLIVKLLTMYFKTPKISNLNQFLKDGEFQAKNKQEEKYLKENKRDMYRLYQLIYIDLSIGGVLWPLASTFRRYHDQDEGIYIYTPYRTDIWPRFFLGLLNQSGLVFWVGHGHVCIDGLIAAYYAQAQTQLKIIKHQLKCLLDDQDPVEDVDIDTNYTNYRDLTDDIVSKRFIKIVIRYEKLVWYLKELISIFNVSLIFQFMTSSGAVCLVIYRMTKISIMSFTFMFLLVVACTLLIQVFLYCYYGNLIEFESNSINTSLYICDWLSLSPAFRRQMLIVMCRWSRPLRPIVGGFIPLSLHTFIMIVKSTYSLYTVLVTTKAGASDDLK